MKGCRVIAVCLLSLTLSSACRHVTLLEGRFLENVRVQYPASDPFATHFPPYVQGDRLVLEFVREIDRSRAIDDEESQFLQLELKDYAIGERIPIPSEKVTPYFRILRFGPASYGWEFEGYLIVQRVSTDRIDAYLSLGILWKYWPAGGFGRTVFRGEYAFLRERRKYERALPDRDHLQLRGAQPANAGPSIRRDLLPLFSMT